jgi:phage-related protein
MNFRLIHARHPNRLKAKHPLIIEDFLATASVSKHQCLKKMIEMVQDLHENGMESRYVKALGGPLYELKGRTSEGGARVYFIRANDDAFILGRAECKKEDEADQDLLSSLLDVLMARDIPSVLSERGSK